MAMLLPTSSTMLVSVRSQSPGGKTDVIRADVHVGEAVDVRLRRSRALVLHLGRGVGGSDGGVLNEGACGVSDRALDAPISGKLGVTLCSNRKDRDTEDNG